ncbi:MAG TPA: M48 family metalloprotease [Xanthobacteraceae bacterium]|nr:M48 family metalloprotease [Xanthobacteraceae bacterium]
MIARATRKGAPAARFAVLLALGLAGSGCANLPQTSHQVSLPDPPQISETVTPSQREHQRILASYGGAYHNEKLELLVNETVAKLVAASDRPDLRYRVTILNSPTVNAFALPSGQLYVTRGMLALANDTSELASVLAHEVAHVIARHAAVREDKARQAAIVSRVVNDVLNDPQMGALALAKSKIALASFSRAQELEADTIGVGLAARAGYDPYGATRFLTAMGRNAALKQGQGAGADARIMDFLSSHPSTPERVHNALVKARQHSAPGAGARDRETYLAALAGVPFGEDPSDGVVRGRRFLHPRLGFTFTAPPGFTLDNTAQAVLGIKDDGSEALRMDVVRVPAEQNLADYLMSGWIEGVDPGSAENLTINGLPAATALAKGEQWTFRLYVVRFDANVYRFVFAAKNRTPATDRAFRAAMDTFRRASHAEVAKTQPLRIRIVTVRPGDTVESFAARMATDRPLERFLLLNGLNHGQPLTPGTHVKIVSE